MIRGCCPTQSHGRTWYPPLCLRMAERANAAELPWVEKYRPQEVTDMVGSEEATSRLQAIAEEGNTPNLIFAVRKKFP